MHLVATCPNQRTVECVGAFVRTLGITKYMSSSSRVRTRQGNRHIARWHSGRACALHDASTVEVTSAFVLVSYVIVELDPLKLKGVDRDWADSNTESRRSVSYHRLFLEVWTNRKSYAIALQQPGAEQFGDARVG